MGWGFLGTIARNVGHDVSAVARGSNAPGGGVFGFLHNQVNGLVPNQAQRQNPAPSPIQTVAHAVQQIPVVGRADTHILNAARDVGQGIVGAGIPIGTEIYNRVVAPIAHLPQQTFNPGQFGTVGTTLLGKNPILSPSQTYTASRQAGHGAPFSFLLGASVAAGAVPFGGGGSDVIKSLVKAGTPEAVTKILPGIDGTTALAIANTKDANGIKNILNKTHDVQSSAPTPPPGLSTDGIKPPDTSVPGQAGGSAEPAANEAINRHLQTLKNSSATTQEMKDAIAGLAQTHEMRSTGAAFEKAQAVVEKDYGGTVAKVLSEPASDQNAFLAQALVQKNMKDATALRAAGDEAGAQAKISEGASIAQQADKILREGGRIAQAGSVTAQLSPEGVLQYATKVIRQARESNPKNIDREIKTAQEIKDSIEQAQPNLKKGDVENIVKEAMDTVNKTPESLSTGEQVAKRVASAASPAVKKQVDTLVNEITNKVKAEYLLPKTIAKKQPLDVIKEVMSRNPEAQAAYPEAQQILREKFGDNPKMMEALDKFFGSKLGTPVSENTFSRAISKQLQTNGVKVSDIIKQSISSQRTSVEQITQDLTKEGFDQQSAQTIAKEVSQRLSSKVAEAKTNVLQNLAKDAKTRNQPTILDKINKFSNLGALNNQDYLDVARAKLGFAHLTPETASKIHDLSQKLQDLPEGHDKYSTVREIQHLIGQEIPLSKRELAGEIFGLPRTILASGDLSFGLRQGLVYATSHPVVFAKAWTKQFEWFKEAFKGSDSEAYDAMMADIRNHPNYPELEKYLKLQEPMGHSAAFRQEQFISSDLANKIPGVGRLVRASNYAYTGLSNYLKANQFYSMVDNLKYAGIPLTEDMGNKIGEVIDTSLGRGGKKGGFIDTHGGTLATGLFAPRLIASRLQVMNPAYYIRLDGPARQEALRGLIGLTGFAASVLGLAKMAGADVGVDPRSADFGKIKIGDTRLDVLGGFTQYIRLGTQLASGEKINSTTGGMTEAGKGFAGSRLDILSNFVQGKENPSVSFITTMLKGKDINGNDLYTWKGVGSQVKDRFIPLLAQDLIELATHPNSVGGSVPGKIGAAAAGVFGVGLQTYGTQDLPITPKQQQYLSDLKDPKAQEGSKAFFQVLKAAPDKTKALNQVHAAIDQQDYQKAEQLAQDYNKNFVDYINKSGWVQKYGQYETPYLEKEYLSSKINLTPQSIKAYVKSKQGVQ